MLHIAFPCWPVRDRLSRWLGRTFLRVNCDERTETTAWRLRDTKRLLDRSFRAKQQMALRFAGAFAPKSSFALWLRNRIFNLMRISGLQTSPPGAISRIGLHYRITEARHSTLRKPVKSGWRRWGRRPLVSPSRTLAGPPLERCPAPNPTSGQGVFYSANRRESRQFVGLLM